MRICIGSYNSRDLFIFKIMKENARNLAENLRRPFLLSSFGDRPKKKFEDLFLENTCACVLGLEHSCPWPRECLPSEKLSLALVPDFFCVLGLEPCVLDTTCICFSFSTTTSLLYEFVAVLLYRRSQNF